MAKKTSDNKNKKADKPRFQAPKPPKMPMSGGGNKATTNVAILLLLIGLVLLSFGFSANSQRETDVRQFSELISEIKGENVDKIVVSPDKEEIEAEIRVEKDGEEKVEKRTYKNISPNGEPLANITNALLTDGDKEKFDLGSIAYEETPKGWFAKMAESPIFQLMFQVLIIGAIAFFLLRQLSSANSRSMQFGASRAKQYDEMNRKKVNFGDVAGNEEAKTELKEVVDFLKRPEEYHKMGAKIPRGVLLVGQPGNGKTLFARAVAGEAKTPFLYVSGSEFVEMFVGVGAGRVRDLFKQAKKQAPCVIFIDEIDAVGRKRGSGVGNSNDEREQTLNQILVEMDGFDESETVVVLAATNRADVLDKALLRPGRFDRQVHVLAPDTKEREQILKVHSEGKKLAKNVDLNVVARRTSGFSGADLANLMNEAAILAVRERQSVINDDNLREAIEKVMLGPSLKSKVVTDKQRKLTAYHEAGHALVAAVLPEADRVQKITIIPRGRAGGYTFTDKGDVDPMTVSKDKFMAEIAVLYAGYIVERDMFGVTSTGPSNDIERATAIAKNMVTKYGMSNLGPINFTAETFSPEGYQYEQSQMMSDKSNEEIDIEIKSILNQGFQMAEKVLKTNKQYLDKIAEALLKDETVEYEQFNKIVAPILVDRGE